MRSLHVVLVVLAVTLFIGAHAAHAQATRTWVSGVGDDAGPCSRTAPCATFAAAIGKTSAGGEIDCLDNGGFGSVSITKSITIDCKSTLGGILAGGTNAIVVVAGANDVVRLRGLSLQGSGTGIDGIKLLSARSLFVEGVVVSGFTAAGIRIAPSTNAGVFVDDTTIDASNVGVLVAPTGGVGVNVLMSGVATQACGNGLSFDGTTGAISATVTHASVAGSSTGISASGVSTVQVSVEASVVSNNTTGFTSSGATTFLLVSNTTAVGNATTASVVNGGQLGSFGNNAIVGAFAATSTLTPK